MLDIVYSKQFKKDYKKIQNNAKFKQALVDVLNQLCQERKLPAKYKEHSLIGEYTGFMECHIKPDLLLIYRIKDDELILYVLRVGSHSELFK